MTPFIKYYLRPCSIVSVTVLTLFVLYINLKFSILEKPNFTVTKIVHQSWKNATIPPIFQRYFPSWRKCFPTWEHRFWTDEDNRALISMHYPWFLSKYDSFRVPVQRADCARYAYLHFYGGLYTDLDNECLASFEHLLRPYTLVFGTIDHVPKATELKENYVQNSFIYSRPNHLIWIELLLDILHRNDTRTADIVTGPIPLSNVIDKYRKRFPNSHGIKIYEARYFNPITWGNQKMNPPFCKIYDLMSADEYQKCRQHYVQNGSYVVQYHTHVWNN